MTRKILLVAILATAFLGIDATPQYTPPTNVTLTLNGAVGTQTSGTGNLNLTTPLLSASDITSITSDGANFTITCPVATCGLSNGVSVNLGMALPAGCADQTGNTNSASGFTIKIANTSSCTASSGPYHNQLGQVVNAAVIQSGASDGAHFDRIQVAADSHLWIQNITTSTVNTQLSLQNSGTASLGSNTTNAAFSLTPDNRACIQPFSALETNCDSSGTGWSGVNGNLTSYRAKPTIDMEVQMFKDSGSFSGNYSCATATGTGCSGPTPATFSTPAAGFGNNTLYEIKGAFLSTGTGTLFVTLTYAEAVSGTSRSISTCSVPATNMLCMGTTAAATTLAAGTVVPFDFIVPLKGSTGLTLATTTASTPTGFFFWQAHAINN